ncbi:hypothetical protein [Streptomyces spiramenti]
MTTWMRCYWDEEDTWFFFEAGPDGWVTRQVELRGPASVPVAAAAETEWQHARDTGRLGEYESRFGSTAEAPVSTWEGHEPEQLTADEFEQVWEAARRHLAAGPR